MSRGVRKTASDQIAEIDAKIQKKQDEIKALQSQRKELESIYQAEIAAQIIQAANQKGMSIEEVLELINNGL